MSSRSISVTLAIAVCICVAGGVDAMLTQEEVDSLKTGIIHHIRDMDKRNEKDISLTAGLVRLAFHDCVGGCDGCINLQNPNNNGLAIYIEQIEEAYKKEVLDTPLDMSRADFWILAAITAAEKAAGGSISHHFVFKQGRVSCPTSPSTNVVHTFPDAMAGLTGTVAFFNTEFGFTQQETIALLGAHTLGRCSAQNSGFIGPWVKRVERLDNEFYKDMLNIGVYEWVQGNNNEGTPANPKWQWNSTRSSMMLNCDMGLAWDLTFVDGIPGEATCQLVDEVNRCPTSAGAELVAAFAEYNDFWLGAFSVSFNKMINHGMN